MTGEPVLAISGSNVTGDAPFSCALSRDGRIAELRSPAGERGDLARLVADLCARERVQPAQVRTVRTDLGPGSYTGLRVAITFARALQRFAAVRVEAIDSLSLLATAALDHATNAARIRPLLDARRERVHCAALRRGVGGRLEVVEPARALPFADVLASVQPDDLFVVPATAPAVFEQGLRAAGVEVLSVRGVAALALFSPALAFVGCKPEELEPRYLMGSYAE